MSSLYFCLVQAGLDKIEICESIAGCLFYSTQGWPALGEQSVDLLVMSYISGTISVIGGLLGTFGIYAAYKVQEQKNCDIPLGFPFFLSIRKKRSLVRWTELLICILFCRSRPRKSGCSQEHGGL